MFLRTIISFVLLGMMSAVWGQNLTGTLRGRIFDRSTQQVIERAKVILAGNQAEQTVFTDAKGDFRFEDVLVGRHNIQVEAEGYQKFVHEDVLVTSYRDVVLEP